MQVGSGAADHRPAVGVVLGLQRGQELVVDDVQDLGELPAVGTMHGEPRVLQVALQRSGTEAVGGHLGVGRVVQEVQGGIVKGGCAKVGVRGNRGWRMESGVWVKCSGFKIEGLGIRIEGLGFRVKGLEGQGFRLQDSEFTIEALGYRVRAFRVIK